MNWIFKFSLLILLSGCSNDALLGTYGEINQYVEDDDKTFIRSIEILRVISDEENLQKGDDS